MKSKKTKLRKCCECAMGPIATTVLTRELSTCTALDVNRCAVPLTIIFQCDMSARNLLSVHIQLFYRSLGGYKPSQTRGCEQHQRLFILEAFEHLRLGCIQMGHGFTRDGVGRGKHREEEGFFFSIRSSSAWEAVEQN